MTAQLTAIFFENETEEALLKISAANGPEELEKAKTIIDMLTDLGDSATEIAGQPDGTYALVLKADLVTCQVVYPYLMNMEDKTAVALPEISLEKIAQSSIFYREDYLEAGYRFEASTQDDAAEEQYETDCRAISSLRAQSVQDIMSPYVTNSPRFFNELVLALDLLAVDYAENLMAATPEPSAEISFTPGRIIQ